MALNDFQIGLIAGLDGTKSKEKLNQDIETLKRQLDNVEIQAKLGKNAVANLTKQLNSTQIILSNVNIDQAAINKMVSQINSALNGITINLGDNLNSSGITHNAKQTGQQIGQIMSNEAQKAIGNVTSNNIGKYFKIDSSTSNQFNSEMKKLVKQWTNGKGKLTDIKVDTKTVYDKDTQANIEMLHQATVTYKNDLDEVIKKTIAWRQIGTSVDEKGNEIPIRGFVEVAGQYSKALDTINQKTDTFIEKQKTAVSKAENTLNSIRNGLTDKGANRTLANTDFDANGLTAAISKAENAIKALGNSTKATFTDTNNEVAKSISELNDLITRLKNAEYAATSLRTKDIGTVKIDETNKLDTFVEKMKQSGHYTDELKTEVSTLRNTLSSVFDANSLTNYLNGMSNLESKFKSVDAQAKTLEKDTKLLTNIEAEKKQLQVYVNELKQADVMSGEVKDKIQQMFSSISKVNTQTELTTWTAELKGVKAETDEVLKSVQKLSSTSIPQAKYAKILNGGYDYDLNKLVSDFQKINAYSDETQAKVISLRQTLAGMQNMSGSELVSTFNKFESEVGKLKVQLNQAKLSYDKFVQPVSDEKITSLLLRIQNFLSKNTNITKEAKTQLELYVNELSGGNVSVSRWNQINQSLSQTETHMRTLGKLGLKFKDQWKQAIGSFGTWLSASTAVMSGITKVRESLNELKEVDNILTEISKTSDRTKEQLSSLGKESFDRASKYGVKASDWLTSVQEMNRSGFYGEKGNQLADVSTLAVSAGDMTSEDAQKWMLATNSAYKLSAEAKKLNDVLDGTNQITNRNSVNLTDMANAMTIVGSNAANAGVKVNELSAIVGTAVATTKKDGNEIGTAFKTIFVNLQNTSSSKIISTLEKAGTSMTEIKNGVEQLRSPVAILKDLAKTYNSLDKKDPLRSEITRNIGGKYYSNILGSTLDGWSQYSKMLNDYAEGSGSAMDEANKSASNWTGNLNKLSNSWTKLVSNFANSDAITNALSLTNKLVDAVANLTDKTYTLKVALGAIFAIMQQKNSGGLIRLIK